MSFSADNKLGELLDNAASKQILVKHLPEVENAGPMLKMARGLTLRALARVAGGKIPPDTLQAIDTELQTL